MRQLFCPLAASSRSPRTRWVALLVAAALACTDDGAGSGTAGNPGTDGGAAGSARPCFQGNLTVQTRADGAGFTHPDGTAVTATVGVVSPQTVTTRVEGGAFSVEMQETNEACSLGTLRVAPAALYIDVDGDGQCSLAEDDVFVWFALGGAGASLQENVVSLSTRNEPCAQTFQLSSSHAAVDGARDALRRLCPEVGDCLPFCRPLDPPMVSLPDRYGGFCGRDPATPDAGSL